MNKKMREKIAKSYIENLQDLTFIFAEFLGFRSENAKKHSENFWKYYEKENGSLKESIVKTLEQMDETNG